MKEKIVGILGGLGPRATVDIFLKIIEATPAKKDWEHLHIIIDNNPKIPSRTRAVLFNEESPLNGMIESARLLERAGVDFIIIPCNSAHYWIDELRGAVKVPILSMIEVVSKWIYEKGYNLVGVIGATVTVKEKLYHKELLKYGITTITLIDDELEEVMKIIDKIKQGEKVTGLYSMYERLFEEGADVVILGCTELPLIEETYNLIDPNMIFAEEVVKYAKGM